jgi:hypothetical protein
MSRSKLFPLILIAAQSVMAARAADETSVKPQPIAGQPTATQLQERDVIKPVLSPMHQEIVTLQETLTKQVADLAVEMKAAGDPAVRLQIQLRIDKAKKDMQLGSLQIQLRYAQQDGRAEIVSKLEAAIEQFEHPVIVNGKPVDRPSPSDAPQH